VCGPYNGYAIKSLILNRLGKIKCPFVLAPMGSFSKGALAIGSSKKKVFLTLMKAFGLFNNVNFSVTSQVEEREMEEALNKKYRCFIAEDPQRKLETVSRNIGSTSEKLETSSEDIINILSNKRYRINDELKMVFLSRISRKKNLKDAAESLKYVKSNVIFDIYGTMEDKEYYKECEDILNTLPDNIRWEYKGEAPSEKVPEILGKYDAFLFPTLGENFGHVISEALSAGTIPVISDTTPWLDFEDKNVGFVKSLDDIRNFSECIDKLSQMPVEELEMMGRNAVNYYMEKYNESVKNSGYVTIFNTLINK